MVATPCYFLLNYARVSERYSTGGALQWTCYFLLNYASGFVAHSCVLMLLAIFFWIMRAVRRAESWQDTRCPLLFSFELCYGIVGVRKVSSFAMSLAIFFWIMPLAGVSSMHRLKTVNLLFSFELCHGITQAGPIRGDLECLAIFFWIMLVRLVQQYDCWSGNPSLLFSFELCPWYNIIYSI